MQEGISDKIVEHGYWGSLRDRLAVAQDDEVKGGRRGPGAGSEQEDVEKLDAGLTAIKPEHGTNEKDANTSSTRIRIPGQKNLCVIRSGQDWSGTLPAERKLYLETMHPVIVEGMNFLRDSGQKIGCYAMNLWDVVDKDTYEAGLERTFGLGFFDDLASLEYWSKSHRTHINIFGGFLIYAKKLNNVLSLRLFHEVYVLDEEQQFFEYAGCHEETGMLNAMKD